MADVESGHGAEKDAGLTGVLATLRGLNLQDLDWELRKLQAIREWAFEQIGIDYRVGDSVRITSDRPSTTGGGWAPYAECLRVGATGIVKRIDFSPGNDERPGHWLADFTPDREWAVGSFKGETRYWHGRFEDTPEGYEPPSKFDRETYPDGRQHTFMFNATWLTRVTSPAGGRADV